MCIQYVCMHAQCMCGRACVVMCIHVSVRYVYSVDSMECVKV